MNARWRSRRPALLGTMLLVLAMGAAGCINDDPDETSPPTESEGPQENAVQDPPQEDSASENPDVLQNEVDQPPGSGA